MASLASGEHKRDDRFPVYTRAQSDIRNRSRYGSNKDQWKDLRHYQREIDGTNWNIFMRDLARAKWDEVLGQGLPSRKPRPEPKPIADPYASAGVRDRSSSINSSRTQDHSRRGGDRR